MGQERFNGCTVPVQWIGNDVPTQWDLKITPEGVEDEFAYTWLCYLNNLIQDLKIFETPTVIAPIVKY